MKNSDLPAFPKTTPDGDPPQKGLTKREYFSGLAMQGLLSNPEWMKEHKGQKYIMENTIIAEIAIKTADEFLKQLDQK